MAIHIITIQNIDRRVWYAAVGQMEDLPLLSLGNPIVFVLCSVAFRTYSSTSQSCDLPYYDPRYNKGTVVMERLYTRLLKDPYVSDIPFERLAWLVWLQRQSSKTLS